MTATEISFQLPEPKPSIRAIRYAVRALIDQGRAQRAKVSHGDLVQGRVLAVRPPEQQAAE